MTVTMRGALGAGLDATPTGPAPKSIPAWGAMTLQDFCRWAGVSRSFVYREIEAGHLTTRKAGRRTLITHEAAHHWLENLPKGTYRNAAEVS